MATFYEEIKTSLRKMLIKNIHNGEKNVDMVMNTLEKTIVAEFVVNANRLCLSKKRGLRYNKGYTDAKKDMIEFFNKNYGQTSRTLVEFGEDK